MHRLFASLTVALAPSLALAAAPKPAALLALPANDHASVSVQLQFRAGSVDDPPGKAGITALAATIMSEGGTAELDAKQLLQRLFPMATDVRARVDKELTTFSATFHRDHSDAMVKILADVVAHPRWDAREFERLRDAAVNDVEKRLRQGDDENLGKEALSELLWHGHPYERLTRGHATDLRSITLDEIKAHAAAVFTRDRLTIGVAGGYLKEMPKQIQSALAGLATPAKAAARPPIKAQAPQGPRLRIVEKDTASTAVSIGMPWTLSRKDADFAAMSIARSAFGEHRQFHGRLMSRLREARGLNYGDYAYIEHFQQESHDAATGQTGRVRTHQYFSIWLRPVQNENRLFALRGALYELDRSLKDEPFSATEVSSTKGFLDGYILLFAQTDERKLGWALDDKQLGLNGFLASWRKKLATVTPEQVNAAWRKWVKPEGLEIVLVTPGAAELRKSILAGSASPIQYQRDAEGQTPAKPPELLQTDKRIESYPIGVTKETDVEVVAVEKLFE